MARREGIRRGSRRSFAGLLITLALHGVIVLAVKAAHSKSAEPLIANFSIQTWLEQIPNGKATSP